MQAALLIRISSKLLSAMMGGTAIFCLYYAGEVTDYNLVGHLLFDGVKWGGCALATAYFQGRYLDR
jgi:hypothetical protein